MIPPQLNERNKTLPKITLLHPHSPIPLGMFLKENKHAHTQKVKPPRTGGFAYAKVGERLTADGRGIGVIK